MAVRELLPCLGWASGRRTLSPAAITSGTQPGAPSGGALRRSRARRDRCRCRGGRGSVSGAGSQHDRSTSLCRAMSRGDVLPCGVPQGVGMLFPWNIFINAEDYFISRFCGTAYEELFEDSIALCYGASCVSGIILALRSVTRSWMPRCD